MNMKEKCKNFTKKDSHEITCVDCRYWLDTKFAKRSFVPGDWCPHYSPPKPEIEIDKVYWEKLQDPDGNADPLAVILAKLKGLERHAQAVNETIPSAISILEAERKGIVKATERTFSDILSLISEFNDGEESLYTTTTTICDYYRKKETT